MYSEIPSRDEICARKPYVFDHDPVSRLIELKVAVAKHIKEPSIYFRYIQDIKANFIWLDERLDSVFEAVKRAERKGLERPMNVQLVIEPTDKGNLRVSYVPEHPQDFGHMIHEYRHHGGHDPINSLIFLTDWRPLWASQSMTSSDPDEDLHLALMRELLITVVALTEYTTERLSKICSVSSKWRFVREANGEYALLSPQQIDAKAEADGAEKARAARERIEAPQKEYLRKSASRFGIEPLRLVALVEAFSRCRVPFAGRVRILRRHYGMKSDLTPGEVRSMKNTFADLKMSLPEAEITLDEARRLAQYYLGKIRNRPSKAGRP
ncbi:hypothetical protein HFN89_05485 [Rhizobium laguerreae]|nr:hypothetical protein [Rhizobium laguerreae]